MTIKLFGYVINIEKDKIKPILKATQSKASWFCAPGCIIAQMGNELLLSDPDGYALPGQLEVSIIAALNEPVKATVTLMISGIIEGDAMKWVSRDRQAINTESSKATFDRFHSHPNKIIP